MQCSFCENTAADPATGCQYTETMLACHDCVVRFWKWMREHTNKKARRPRNGERSVMTALTFYEAAGKK